MATERNIGRAQELLDSVPNGVVTFRSTMPWVVKVLVFLLCRYIAQD